MSTWIKKKVYYGWVIAVVCFAINLIVFGTRYSFGVFFKPMESEFGLNRAQTSIVFSAYMLFSCVFSILGGGALNRYGPRRILLFMSVFTGLGLVLTGLTGSVWQLFFSYSLLLAIGTGGVYTVVMATISRWFDKRRATALGIAGAGVGLGSIIMTPVAASLIASFDWRTAYVIVGVVSGVIFLAISRLMKKDPGEIGLLPDNAQPGRARLDEGPQKTQAARVSLRQTFKTRNFWLFQTVWLSWAFTLHLILAHLVPHITDVGIPATQAALILGIVGGFSVLGRLTMGWVSDRVDRRWAAVFCALLQSAGVFWLIWSQDMRGFYLFTVIFGLGYGGADPPTMARMGDLFGTRNLGAVMGMLSVGWAIGAAAGPAVAGLLYDVNGNYVLAFLLGAIAMLLNAAAMALTRRQDKPGTV